MTGGATPVSTLADWLVSTFDQNVSKEGDSIATDVEWQTIQWLCELFDLPQSFKGLMTTGATAANFIGACVARQYAGNQQGIDVAKEGVYGLDVEIFTTTPHASMIKSLGMSGLGQRHVTKVAAMENSRRFRALPVWLSLLAYGKAGVTDWVKSNIECAKQLADWIEHSPDYEIVYPCQMNVVLFRPNCDGLDARDSDILTANRLEQINRDGKFFLSPGEWQGKKIIRAALSNWQTEASDIDIATQVLEQMALVKNYH